MRSCLGEGLFRKAAVAQAVVVKALLCKLVSFKGVLEEVLSVQRLFESKLVKVLGGKLLWRPSAATSCSEKLLVVTCSCKASCWKLFFVSSCGCLSQAVLQERLVEKVLLR